MRWFKSASNRQRKITFRCQLLNLIKKATPKMKFLCQVQKPIRVFAHSLQGLDLVGRRKKSDRVLRGKTKSSCTVQGILSSSGTLLLLYIRSIVYGAFFFISILGRITLGVWWLSYNHFSFSYLSPYYNNYKRSLF